MERRALRTCFYHATGPARRWVFLTLGLLVLVAGSARVRPSGWLTGQISGRVLLFEGSPPGQPFAGVSVSLVDLDWGTEKTLSSGPDGRFQFLQVRPANYRVRVEREGYELKQGRSEDIIRLRPNEPKRVLPDYHLVLSAGSP